MPDNPEPNGRVVIISDRPDGQYFVTVLPPPPSGDVFRTFVMKIDAFEFAREMWVAHRCGLRDQTEWSGLAYRGRTTG